MNEYINPLCTRYSSKDMKYIFSPNYKFKTWRKLWLELAKVQKKLGLTFITNEMINEIKNNINNIDYEIINKYEKELKHDVMAHIKGFGERLFLSKGIIHLGATSAYVVDNTDIIQIREALILIKSKILTLIETLSKFCMKYKDLHCLGYTHFQPAQITTLGKRASLWLHSLMSDLNEINHRIDELEFRGVKGTIGTQASYKKLFNNDYEKVNKLDKLISKAFNFNKVTMVCGQTYDRKQDTFILSTLSNIASSFHKITNDIRLLQHEKEIEEPFGNKQIGSSAMMYKRNPIRCERIASLSKYIISLNMNGYLVQSTQWLERTLDDSANKRLSIPQAFLGVDSIIILLNEIIKGLNVYPKIIEKNILKELPFMVLENILMELTKKGIDRQEGHEILREISMKVTKDIKLKGKENQLINEIIKDKRILLDKTDLDNILDYKKYSGFASKQVEEYINNYVKPILIKNKRNKKKIIDYNNV